MASLELSQEAGLRLCGTWAYYATGETHARFTRLHATHVCALRIGNPRIRKQLCRLVGFPHSFFGSRSGSVQGGRYPPFAIMAINNRRWLYTMFKTIPSLHVSPPPIKQPSMSVWSYNSPLLPCHSRSHSKTRVAHSSAVLQHQIDTTSQICKSLLH